MNKSVPVIMLSFILSVNLYAQKMEKQLYSEDIEIVDNTDKKLAHINVYGKVTLLDGVESSDVINMLIRRASKENAIHNKNMQQAKKMIIDNQQKSQLAVRKASEIIRLYVQVEEPKKKEVKEVKKEKPKKKRWSWFTRKDK